MGRARSLVSFPAGHDKRSVYDLVACYVGGPNRFVIEKRPRFASLNDQVQSTLRLLVWWLQIIFVLDFHVKLNVVVPRRQTLKLRPSLTPSSGHRTWATWARCPGPVCSFLVGRDKRAVTI